MNGIFELIAIIYVIHLRLKELIPIPTCQSSSMTDSSIVHYFLQLPVDIIRSIFTIYLQGKSKYSLLQTTEKFNHLRKQIIYFKLNKIESKKFYLNRRYRQKILSCLYQPQYQLHLILDNLQLPDGGWPTILDLSVALPVHRLQIISFKKINNLHLIGANTPSLLDISGCDSSIDIEHCKGISTLSLTKCCNIQYIEKFSEINVFYLRTCLLANVNFSIFGSLQIFALTDCTTITDVSPLAHIRELTLMTCPNITNIDVLTHNDKLSICDCPGIKTISLSDHPREEVNIARSSKLVGLTIAGKVGKVNLNFLSRLFDISLLDCVNKLTIVEADSLIRLTNLKYVQSISLLTCNQLVELSTLLQVKSLEINECQSLLSIRSLQYLDRLTICSAEELQSIEDLPLLRSLEIDDCQNLAKLTNLPFCKDYEFNVFFGKLEVLNCPGYVERDDL